MYPFSRQLLIKPEMSKYIRESTNKSISQYLKPIHLYNKSILPTTNIVLIFVSLISFSIGYKVGRVVTNK